MATAKTRPARTVSLVVESPVSVPTTAQPTACSNASALLDELFAKLKPFGACESAEIVTLFHRIKMAV